MSNKQKEDNPEQKRLKILSNEELDEIYGRPCFTYEDRQSYFSLNHPEKELLLILRSIRSQAYFILQLGYFKAKHQFFIFELNEVAEDLHYMLGEHFGGIEITDLTPIVKLTRLKQQRLILELFNYRDCNSEERQKMGEKARKAAALCSKPIYIFREIMHYLYEQRIVAPGYSFIQDTVGKAITYEQARLIAIMHIHLKLSDIDDLKKLLDDSPGLFEITQLKHEPKDFTLGEINSEINRGKRIQPLYQFIQKLLPELGISNESIKYYASLVDYYSVYKLKRFSEWLVYLYLLCFIYHRFQQVNDNLINTLIYNIRGYIDASKLVAKERVYEYMVENNQNLKKVGQVLKIFTDNSIAANTPFRKIQSKAFAILEQRKLEILADQIATDTKFDETALQWEHIDKLSHQIKLHLRPILLMADFSSPLMNDPLIEAIEFMTMAFIKNKPLGQYDSDTLPSQFIPGSTKHYIYQQNILLANRYEFQVYRLLRNSLEAGDIYCRDSIRFRSLEDDLINDRQWQDKDKLITEAGLTILNQPIKEHLEELEQRLEARITEVNRRIESGENEYFKVKKNGTKSRWTLQYSNDADEDDEFINNPFFDALKQIEINSVLHFVNQHCHFLEAFEHVLGRYAKHDGDDRILVACIIAWGTNMGLGKMGETSDISYSTLDAASDNFIRLETLKEANNRVSNATAQLPIFRYFDIDEVLHSSSDGQKHETRINTINSRHSPKYFGLGKGISNCTLVINHVPVNAKIIGSHEYEGSNVFDILYNNTTDIQPDIHSTDTHGTNEVNFAILYFFGYQFAPRYRNIYDRVNESLYGFRHPSQYNESFIIKPIRKINVDLIEEEWENIQRIIVSLALKTTTQSIIIGKLSSHARKNKTKRALWEYDNIHKSLYLLDYIDSLQLRQNVQRALNRGESYHKLVRAISYANFGKLRFKTEQEQQIWAECARLIANCIIYYNASIMSSVLTYKEGNGQDTNFLKQISPVSWQHINICGRYEFNKNSETINMDEIAQKLVELNE